MKLNYKIAEILKQHEGGEEFFDALDAMVRGDMDILNTFLNFVYFEIGDTKEYSLILSGQFGNALMGIYGAKLFEDFSSVILVEGGLRSGKTPTIFRQNFTETKFILLDDSFYSGTTKNTIERALKVVDSQAKIVKTFVIYDGSKTKEYNLYSMFRYYDHYKSNK